MVIVARLGLEKLSQYIIKCLGGALVAAGPKQLFIQNKGRASPVSDVCCHEQSLKFFSFISYLFSLKLQKGTEVRSRANMRPDTENQAAPLNC